VIGILLRSDRLNTLRFIVVCFLYGVGIYAAFKGAELAFWAEARTSADYLMLTVACMVFGTLIHKVKETKKEESKPNG
jgi:hypothetical protein